MHNTNNVDIYSSSLLNFCQVLILIIERENTINHFQQVCQKYQDILINTDPFLSEVIKYKIYILDFYKYILILCLAY